MKNNAFFKIGTASLLAFSLNFVGVTPSQAGGFVPTYEQCKAMGKKITICHATSSSTNPYVEETIACEAMYGKNENAGHFSENGTPLAGHEDDYVLDEGGSCGVSPTPTPIPKTDPGITPQSKANNDQNGGRQTSLANDNLQCTSTTFDAVMDVKDNGNPVKDLLVRFVYNGATKESHTNENGRAKVNFDQSGNGSLIATAEGYPSQSMYITPPQCSPVALDPNKNQGSPRTGQVLGATTLANTGSGPVYSLVSLFMAGLLMTLTAIYGYYQDQKTQK